MIRFFNILICLFVVLALFSAGAAWAKKAHKVLHMPPNKIADFVVQTAGDKRIVFIYASWCPACRQLMPQIMDIENIKPGSVIAISEDEDHPALARYINQYKKIPFMLFLSRPTSKVTLKGMMQSKLGVKPWEGYPHIIMLDAENNIVGQGNYSAEQVADFLLKKEETEE